MSITIEDLAYRELTDEPTHLDASLTYRIELASENESDCVHYGYRLRLFTQMRGVSDFNKLDEQYEICTGELPVTFKLFHEQDPVTCYGLFAHDAVVLKDDARLDSVTASADQWQQAHDCRVYSNTLISVEDDVIVEGSLYAPEIDLSENATCTGSINDLATPQPWFESSISKAFDLALQINDNDQAGGITGLFEGPSEEVFELEQGLYYVENLTLTDNTRIVPKGRVIIFSAGDVLISGTCQVNAAGNPLDLAIYSDGNIRCADQALVQGHLHALNGEIVCSGNTLVRGSLTARSIILSGSTRFEHSEDNYDRALSFGVLSLRTDSGESDDRIVLFQAHKNSLLMTKKLDVENGSFIWRTDTGDQETQQEIDSTINTSYMTLKGYAEYNLIIEHRVLEKVVFDELPTPYYNVQFSLLRWVYSGQSGYLNFTRQWAYHWSVYNTDMNSNDTVYHCKASEGLLPANLSRDISGNKFSFQPFIHVGEGSDYTFCPGAIFFDFTPGLDRYKHKAWYNSYARRMTRLFEDLDNVGATVQLDLFDHSMVMCTYPDVYWNKNPYNPANQAPIGGYLCVNDLDDTQEFCTIDPDHDLVYQQQEYFIQKIVNFCKSRFNNVFYDVINEGHYSSPATAQWYDRMIAKIIAEDPGALISINVYPDVDPPIGWTKTAWCRHYLKDKLWSNLNQKNNVDIISYHAPFWRNDDLTSCISDLLGWHYLHLGFGRASIIDDDGASTAREDNYNVSMWACEAENNFNASFIHKDNQCWCRNSLSDELVFIQDAQAKWAIDTTPYCP